MKTKQRYVVSAFAALAAASMMGTGIAYASIGSAAQEATGYPASVLPETNMLYESDSGSNHRIYAGEAAVNLFAPASGGAQADFTFPSSEMSGKFLRIRLQNLTAGKDVSLTVSLLSGEDAVASAQSFTYYLDGEEKTSSNGKIALESGGTYEGYCGELMVPVSAFAGVVNADGVRLQFQDASSAAYLRVNIFSIAVADDAAAQTQTALWEPAEGVYTAAVGTSSRRMEAGEFYVYDGASAGYGNTENYLTFPQSALDEDGHIDTSVYKGVVVTVEMSGLGMSSYYYDAMNVFLSTAPDTKKTMGQKLLHIDHDSASPAYSDSHNCGIAANYTGDVYMSFADCGIEEGALLMPYVGFNSGHKALQGKSWKLSYRLVAQTADQLYTVSEQSDPHADVAFEKLRYAAGEEVGFTVTPKTGYEITSVLLNGERLSSDNGTYSFIGNSDCEVAVTASPVEYEVKFYDGDDLLTDDAYRLTYTIEQGTALPDLADRATEVFIGWYDAPTGGSQVIEIGTGETGDRELYARFTSENVVQIALQNGEGGSAALDRQVAIAGDEVTLTVAADYGYRIASATCNGEDILDSIEEGVYTIKTQEGVDITFAVTYEKIEMFVYSGGDAFFTYDSFSDTQGFMGAVFAQFDAVNVRGRAKSSDPALYAGIEADAANTAVQEGDVLSIRYEQLVLGADVGLKIALRSGEELSYVSDGASYTVVHADGSREELSAQDGIVLTKPNATEAFSGYLLIPMTAFGVQQFDAVVLSSPMTDYVRHNFGEIAVVNGAEQTVIWRSSDLFAAWQSAGTPDGTLFEAQAMQAGEVAIVEASKGTSTTWSYEQYGFMLPEEMVNGSGVVDLEALGVTGMLISVSNPGEKFLAYQVGIVDAKYAGMEGQMSNAIAAYRWITASTTKTVYCYENGEMIQGGATTIPAGFEGKIYVPFSSAAFSKGANLGQDEEFPTQILPYIYGGLSTGEAGARVYIKGVEFVTDDTLYTPYDIGIFDSTGGTVVSDLASVGYGTEVTISVTPDAGYRVKYADFYMGDAPAQTIELSDDGTYTFIVTGTVMVDVTFEAIEYSIVYVLPEGATHGNPQTYTVLRAETLTDPVLDGYIFEGWYLTEDREGEPIVSIARGTTGDITLYAKFAPIAGEGPNVGLIVGCTAAGIVVIAAAVAIPLAVKKRKQNK